MSTHVLVIAPHHDDEAIGCGGTIARLAAAGCDVATVHVFAGTSGIAGLDPLACSGARAGEAEAAAAVLNTRVLPSLGFEDRGPVSPQTIARALVRTVRELRPRIVFAPHAGEPDAEHALVAAAAIESVWMSRAPIWPEQGEPVSESILILGYEVWRPMTNVGLFVDIGAFIDVKRRALAAFASQMTPEGWLSGAIGLSAYRGTTLLGGGYAEAFSTHAASCDALSVLIAALETSEPKR